MNADGHGHGLQVLCLCLSVSICGLLFSFPAAGQSADQRPAQPGKLLVLARGAAVSLAWTLGDGLRPHTVVVYRADKESDRFEQVAELDAAVRGWTDERVTLGRTYLYQLEGVRGGARSGPSAAAEILVGGGARVWLRGGSPDRAVFEVTIFREGRSLSATFAHGPGEPIGDLVYVNDLQQAVDFRVGARLRELALTRAYAPEAARETLKDAVGVPIADLAGRPITLDFRTPGPEREVLSAMIELPGSKFVPLLEGAATTVP